MHNKAIPMQRINASHNEIDFICHWWNEILLYTIYGLKEIQEAMVKFVEKKA